MSIEGNKKRWAGVPAKERSERMQDMAFFKWFMKTPKERRKHAMTMVKAKKLKVKSLSKANVIKIKFGGNNK